MIPNTLLFRLEGPMQAWGSNESKFVIRRTMDAPTKSGVIGLILASKGISRDEARDILPKFSALNLGVRIDRPGIRWWDYHTVGAKLQMQIASGGTKPGAMLTRREYLCDASFLVALQGDSALIEEIHAVLMKPKWTLYLGRKCCPPGMPLNPQAGEFGSLSDALMSTPWRRRAKNEEIPDNVDCLLDWEPSENEHYAPDDVEVWFDVPLSFDPPSHRPRLVIRESFEVKADGGIAPVKEPLQSKTPAPLRPRADYGNTKFREVRGKRLDHDHHLCVFCKSYGTTVQHVTYRHAGGGEGIEELKTLCRLCHDAVTMIEYGMGMGIDRIDPEDSKWRDLIIEKREEIINFRSLQTRSRKFKQYRYQEDE